ncbi:Fis family transcriptional regulator [Burkholderia ubonensis]|nr:sigma-54 dependent transcriptional regulator [Burkholderia ubonensis]KVN50064.1 Fis family transcriptional regulator [Burkholderia ubonensis]
MKRSDGTSSRHTDGMRPLVYLAHQPDAALVRFLGEYRWDVMYTVSPQDAHRIRKIRHAAAGIVDFDGFTPRNLASFEHVLKHRRVGWVALTSCSLLKNELAIRQLVSQYCLTYVSKPQAHTMIEHLVRRAYEFAMLHDPDPVTISATDEEAMLGTCEAMQQLFRTIRKVATSDASVFISGESGTGKELTAAAIHMRSARREAPFVAINCGSIPHHLLQSELFGYERGAFTGAEQRKIGRVEEARGGTLFLDEIGDIPLESQASMLRFLQEGTIERLGGHESIQVDARIVSATHIDLEAAVRAGRFRADLFHRLCVLHIDEPPLRVRGKDIRLLADHALSKYRSESTRKIRGFAPSAIEAIYNYSWPGNVRELLNRVRSAIVMTDDWLISAADLGLVEFTSRPPESLSTTREVAERRAIEAALVRHPKRPLEAAAELGVSRATMYRLIREYRL